MALLFEVGTALILLFGGRGIIRGELSLGDFVAFVGYLGMLAWPIIAVGWVANLFQRGGASMKRLVQILDTEPEIQPPAVPARRAPCAVKSSSITSPSPMASRAPALADLDFTIPAGRTVAIVGRTGSGKTHA